MAQLHPYGYVYFNRAFGGLAAASNRFETDYWGLSMPEAVIWLNQHRESKLPLVSTEPFIAANNLFAECPMIYSVARQQVPLSIVKQCTR